MAEKGIDITAEQPKRWTHDMLEAADVVVTMGCGDTCPVLPGRRYEEWLLPDPAGQPLEAVRPIRDEIDQRVRTLLAQTKQPHGIPARGCVTVDGGNRCNEDSPRAVYFDTREVTAVLTSSLRGDLGRYCGGDV
jgi:hypothetical protein